MRRTAFVVLAALGVSVCSLLFPEDPRLGAESAEECGARITGLLGPTTSFQRFNAQGGVPSFAYDITKMGLEEIQGLIVTGSDETAGSRGMSATNETSTAIARFMDQSIDENGAFFLGTDPALYRVRGSAQQTDTMIASGCARQQANMRLIMIDMDAPPEAESDLETNDTLAEENNS